MPRTFLFLLAAAAGSLLAYLGGRAVMAYEALKPYASTIAAAAALYGVPKALLEAQLMQESGGDPNAVSPAGAEGIAQFMPATAAALGLVNPFDPVASIQAEARYMAQLYQQFGNWPAALAAYNWGPGNLTQALASSGGDFASALASAPTETQNYVSSIGAAFGV